MHDVADRAGLHPNTARFHLDALVKAGLAMREPQPRDTPGRPNIAYRVTGGDGPDRAASLPVASRDAHQHDCRSDASAGGAPRKETPA